MNPSKLVRVLFFSLIATTLFAPSFSMAQEPALAEVKSTGPYTSLPKLKLVSEDKFSEDSRAEYEIDGVAKWETGKLVLTDGCTVSRKLESAGPWVEVDLDLSFPKLKEDGQNSGLRVYADLDNEPDSFIWFRQKRENGRTRSAIFVFELTGNWKDAEGWEKKVRGVRFDTPLPSGSWKISYRYGLWQIYHDRALKLSAATFDSPTMLNRVIVQNNGLNCAADKFRVSHSELRKTKISDIKKSKLRKSQRTFRSIVRKLDRPPEALYSLVPESVALTQKDLDRSVSCSSDFQEVWGKFHPLYVESLYNLSEIYRRRGENKKAESSYLDALSKAKQVLGAEHPLTATILSGLALLKEGQNDPKNAEALLVEAYKISTNTFEREDPEYFGALANLAFHYTRQNARDKAHQFYVAATEISETAYGEESAQHMFWLNELANNHD